MELNLESKALNLSCKYTKSGPHYFKTSSNRPGVRVHLFGEF